MKLLTRSSSSILTILSLAAWSGNHNYGGMTTAFAPTTTVTTGIRSSSTLLHMSSPSPMDDKTMMAQAAAQMRNLTPEQIDEMIRDMESMGPIQKNALKAMGMNPESMISSMKMMKGKVDDDVMWGFLLWLLYVCMFCSMIIMESETDIDILCFFFNFSIKTENPEMIQVAQKMMETMTPEQMMEQSKKAQQQMQSMTPEQVAQANEAMKSIPKEQLQQAAQVLQEQEQQQSASSSSSTVDVTAEDEDDEEDEDDTPTVMATGPGTSSDPNVVQAMYVVAEFMSNDSEATTQGVGGVTYAGLSSLPPIQLLLGEQEDDLNVSELQECWESGSLGATRIDLKGFERVWKEIQDYFEADIMGEARKEAKKRVSGPPKKKRNATAVKPTTTSTSTTSNTPKVGANLDPQALDAMKNMKEEDLSQMFAQMENMDPAMEARLKAMGTDPSLLKKTAQLLNSNPTMRKAAQDMMKNMKPEEMIQMSQKAQEQMKNMTPEEIQKAMNVSPEMAQAFEGMSMEEIQEAMKTGTTTPPPAAGK